VEGDDLAAVEADRADRPLSGADLDPATDQAGIERVVVSVKAELGLSRDQQRDALGSGRHSLGQRPHALSLGEQPLRGDRADALVGSGVGAPRDSALELGLVVALGGEGAGPPQSSSG